MAINDDFRILVIDDNPAIHRDFIKILAATQTTELDQLGSQLFNTPKSEISLPQFKIDTATQGEEGVGLIKAATAEGHPYSVAFVDIRMPPGWDGVETTKHIWEIDDNIQVVICTAYSDYSWEETVSNLGQNDNLLILKKPFDNVAVRQLASALSRKWQLFRETRRNTISLKQQIADSTISLQKSLSLVKSTFESSSDGIVVLDNEGNITDYNQKFIELLLIPPSIMETSKEADLLGYMSTQLAEPEKFIAKVRLLHEQAEEVSIDVVKYKNGQIFECYSQPHKMQNEVIGRILDFRDITNRAKLEEKLQFQATHDGLTGLPNRVELLQKINYAITTCPPGAQFALLFLDLDRFKLINDSLSHAVGDLLLQTVAGRMQKILREQDTLARLGGDEFVILLPAIKSKEEVIGFIKNIIGSFHAPLKIENRNIVASTSIGVSIYPTDGETPDVLLRNADAAMYRAKEKRGNDYQFYSSEMNLKSLEMLEQEEEMRTALANEQFFLVYQPQMDMVQEKLVAVEALIRWQHPARGVLLPLDFIPQAEDAGLIVPISEWILRKACMQNKAWQDQGLPPIRVAVNLSAAQFKQQNLIATVQEILADSGLDPKYLELELTENVIISNVEVLKTVEKLKALGVMLTIDDFGTGYSSLSYLHKIPLDRLKIDSSFIKNIQSPQDDEVIVRAVIAIAKNLKLEVMAEGVQNIDQLNFLKKYDCEEVQGYYFSEPLSRQDLQNLMENPEDIKKMKPVTK